MNYSGSFSWVTFSIVLCYFITGSAECSFLWCLLPRATSTVNLFHVTFFKIKAMHGKISYPVQRDFQYFSTLLLFYIHFSWAVCLIPDLLPQADTGLYLQVGSQDMRWVYLLYSAFLVVVGIWCAFLGGKWQYCYFTWARHMAEHSATEKCWWVNSESLRAKYCQKKKNQQFQIGSRSVSEDFRPCWNFCLQLPLCYVVCVGCILCCDIWWGIHMFACSCRFPRRCDRLELHLRALVPSASLVLQSCKGTQSFTRSCDTSTSSSVVAPGFKLAA